MARLNAIVVRDDQAGALAYHLLFDSTAAVYMVGCIGDAAGEFGGRAIGLKTLTAGGIGNKNEQTCGSQTDRQSRDEPGE